VTAPAFTAPGVPPSLAPPGEAGGALSWRAPYPWWYPRSARGRAIEWASIGSNFLPLAAATTGQQVVNISGGFAFVILSSQLEVRDDAAGNALVAAPNALIQLQDGTGDSNLFNAPLHVGTVFGTAQQPFFWQVPRILAPNTAFQLTVQNLDTAVSYRMFFTFSGFRIWGNRPE
jgi:hypothetical protein